MSAEHKRYGRKRKFFFIGLYVALVITSGGLAAKDQH